AAYENQDKYFGAIIGRYANRIDQSTFLLNGKQIHLNENEKKNQLHGGNKGFDKKVWDAVIEGDQLVLSYLSKDGEEGYPGNLNVQVLYSLTNENELKIEYRAVSDQDTIVGLTNHSYFNLDGQDADSIETHYLKICADFYTPIRTEMIPTGEIASVSKTPFDFTNFHEIGERIEDKDEQLRLAGGYDHNYALNGEGVRLAAELFSEHSGIDMKVFTDMSGIQLYTGNFIEGASIGKNGTPYHDRCAVCLETQFFPNSPNCLSFPSPILRAGELYEHHTIYQFDIQK
ncbi:MAG: aldose epimerase family protein, partial [Oscillospiraceae bacterium]